jgi:hypothetical protein
MARGALSEERSKTTKLIGEVNGSVRVSGPKIGVSDVTQAPACKGSNTAACTSSQWKARDRDDVLFLCNGGDNFISRLLGLRRMRCHAPGRSIVAGARSAERTTTLHSPSYPATWSQRFGAAPFVIVLTQAMIPAESNSNETSFKYQDWNSDARASRAQFLIR